MAITPGISRAFLAGVTLPAAEPRPRGPAARRAPTDTPPIELKSTDAHRWSWART